MDAPREILSLEWARITHNENNKECFVSDFTVFWYSKIIQIKIHSFWGNGPGGLRTHYDFHVDGINYSYNMIHSYMVGTNGAVPKIEYKNMKLIVKAGPTGMEIVEQTL